MSLWRTLLILSFLAIFSREASAKIYIYEVVTEQRRFQTASKLQPSAFLSYYGGKDIIYELTVVDVMKGDNFEEAVKKYKLDDNNYRDLSPKISQRPRDFRRFVWWK